MSLECDYSNSDLPRTIAIDYLSSQMQALHGFHATGGQH